SAAVPGGLFEPGGLALLRKAIAYGRRTNPRPPPPPTAAPAGPPPRTDRAPAAASRTARWGRAPRPAGGRGRPLPPRERAPTRPWDSEPGPARAWRSPAPDRSGRGRGAPGGRPGSPAGRAGLPVPPVRQARAESGSLSHGRV